jgi:hypothetical protein
MDHAIIRPSQSLVKGGGPAAQFRLSAYPEVISSSIAIWEANEKLPVVGYRQLCHAGFFAARRRARIPDWGSAKSQASDVKVSESRSP